MLLSPFDCITILGCRSSFYSVSDLLQFYKCCDLIVSLLQFQLLIYTALVISSSAFPGSVQNPKCVQTLDFKCKGLGLSAIFHFQLLSAHLAQFGCFYGNGIWCHVVAVCSTIKKLIKIYWFWGVGSYFKSCPIKNHDTYKNKILPPLLETIVTCGPAYQF